MTAAAAHRRFSFEVCDMRGLDGVNTLGCELGVDVVLPAVCGRLEDDFPVFEVRGFEDAGAG